MLCESLIYYTKMGIPPWKLMTELTVQKHPNISKLLTKYDDCSHFLATIDNHISTCLCSFETSRPIIHRKKTKLWSFLSTHRLTFTVNCFESNTTFSEPWFTWPSPSKLSCINNINIWKLTTHCWQCQHGKTFGKLWHLTFTFINNC